MATRKSTEDKTADADAAPAGAAVTEPITKMLGDTVHVRVYHPGLDQYAWVPAESMRQHASAGWQLTDQPEPPAKPPLLLASDGQPLAPQESALAAQALGDSNQAGDGNREE